jgi:hypothetical protein
MKIMDTNPGNFDQKEVRFLLTAGISVEMERPNLTSENGWISNKMWSSILYISREITFFNGPRLNIEKNLEEW